MRALASVLAALVLAACGGAGGAPSATDEEAPPGTPEDAQESGELPAMPPFDTGRVTLVGPGGQRVDKPVYIADDESTRRQGLMGVTDLPWDAGMVFLFDEDRTGGFWMKNTLLPLSIAFFGAEGPILAVLDMEPCEADPCPSYEPQVAYRGALEVNQGRFDELGFDEAWTVELSPGIRG